MSRLCVNELISDGGRIKLVPYADIQFLENWYLEISRGFFVSISSQPCNSPCSLIIASPKIMKGGEHESGTLNG